MQDLTPMDVSYQFVVKFFKLDDTFTKLDVIIAQFVVKLPRCTGSYSTLT